MVTLNTSPSAHGPRTNLSLAAVLPFLALLTGIVCIVHTPVLHQRVEDSAK